MKLVLIVLTVTTQNALQTSINTECHPDKKRGVVCLHNENKDKSDNGDKAPNVNDEAEHRYQERTLDFITTEDISVSYEGLRNIAEDIDSSKSVHKTEIEHRRELQDQDDVSYNNNLRFDSYENRKDVPVAMDKSESQEYVIYKSREKLRNSSGLKDISDSDEKVALNPFKYIRNSPKNIAKAVKYENYEKFRGQMGNQHWKFGPNHLAKNNKFQGRFFPWIIGYVFQTVVRIGVSAITTVGNTVENVVDAIVGK